MDVLKDPVLTVCAWCLEEGRRTVLRGEDPGAAGFVAMLAEGRVSHGMCPAHFAKIGGEAAAGGQDGG
jgi:hypothetical protein